MARLRRLIISLFPAATLLLCSCSPPRIDIKMVQANGRLLVELSQDWGLIFSDAKPPCVEEAKLFRESERDSPIWKIVAKGDVQCLDLASFVIGSAPNGFDEIVMLPALAKGAYTLEVWGIGYGEAALRL